MKICILGVGLTSLTLAKLLVNKTIAVDLLFEDKAVNYSKSRTFGITKKNYEFFAIFFISINGESV